MLFIGYSKTAAPYYTAQAALTIRKATESGSIRHFENQFRNVRAGIRNSNGVPVVIGRSAPLFNTVFDVKGIGDVSAFEELFFCVA
jgi:hypothetical protein